MHITRMSVAIPMRVPLNKYHTIYFFMNSSAMPHWLHQLLTRDVDQIHKISSKLRANSRTKVCSLSFCCISRRKRQTQSWYWLVLYRHSCDVATNLPPHNPDSSFPIGNKLYGFKRHTSIQACLQGPYNNWSWPTQRSKWPVKASKGVTQILLTDKASNISKTSPEENTNHSSNSRSHLGNIMKNTCGAVPIHF